MEINITLIFRSALILANNHILMLRNERKHLEKLTQTLTKNEWATCLHVLGPYRCYCGHILILAHSRPYHPQVWGCATLYAVAEEPNGELGPTTTSARLRIRTHDEH